MKVRSETCAGITTLYIGNVPICHNDAKEIIRRVNAHDGLVAALREIHSANLIPGLYHGGETYYGLNQRIKWIAEAAIAAAEEAT